MLLLACGWLPAQEQSPVLKTVRLIAAEPAFKTASVAFCAIDLADPTAASALAFQADTALVPASTLKAITTATALEVLGAGYRFQTTLQHSGTIDDEGILRGDLIIQGGGDPTLAENGAGSTLSKWSEAVRGAGITRIEGRVIGDDAAFGTQILADSWAWNDLGNYYAAGPSALTFLNNQFHARFRTTTAPGTIAEFLGTRPKLPGIAFVNEMKVGAAGSGDQGYIYGQPFGTEFYLRGTVPAGGGEFEIKGSLPDPAFFCARSFHEHLIAQGIPVSGVATTHRRLQMEKAAIDGARQSILVQQSEPLETLIVLTNHKSVNLRAEAIHRAMGMAKKSAGTTAAASEVVKEFWAGHGLDMTGFVMADGCGLSRSNTITARQTALMLHKAASFPTFPAFRASLPVAGQSGTLSSFGRGTVIEGNVRAKSGTIDRVRNYAGYLTAASGKRYAFAVFLNQVPGEIGTAKDAAERMLVSLRGN